jgi:hypothetical protein
MIFRMTAIFAAVGTLLLSGCDSSTGAPPKSEVMPGVKFAVVPDSVRVCDPPTTAKVSWNAKAAGIDVVKVFVGAGGQDKLNLFASSAAEGSAETGPWVSANQVFVLKNGDETQQLAKFVVGSESCD